MPYAQIGFDYIGEMIVGDDAPNQYDLILAAGSFSQTGQNAAFLANRKIALAAGGYNKTGQTANLLKGSKLILAAGAYNKTGQSAIFNAGRKITIITGAFTKTGSAAGLFAGRLLKQTSGGASSFYRTVTVDKGKVPNTDQTDFTVIISGTYTYLKTVANGGKVENSSGYDIGFYSDAGLTTKLPWKIIFYDPATGQIIAAVKKTVTTATDAVFYIGYGNTSITTDQSDPTNAYDSNYLSVHSLGDGSTLDLNDSTANGHNGTNINGATAAAGQIGGGANFYNPSNQRIDLGNYADNLSDFSASILFKTSTSYGNPQVLIGKLDNNHVYGAKGWQITIWDTSGVIESYVQTTASDWKGRITQGTNYADGAWHHAFMSWNGTTFFLLVDGLEIGTIDDVGGTYTSHDNTEKVAIGGHVALNCQYMGDLDEARISNSARSKDWAITESNNLLSPSTFYTLGTEQTLTGSGPTYTKTGNAVNFIKGYSIPMASGAYNKTGSAANFIKAAKIILSAGAYNKTGSSGNFTAGRLLAMAAGLYNQTGGAVNFLKGSKIIMASGAYNKTGNAANFSKASRLILAAAAFTQSGSPAAFIKNNRIAVETGAFNFTGVSANFKKGHHLTLQPGAFNFTGNELQLIRGLKIIIQAGAYNWTGSDAEFISQVNGIEISGGNFSLTGNQLLTSINRRLEIGGAVYIYTGNAASLKLNRPVSVITEGTPSGSIIVATPEAIASLMGAGQISGTIITATPDQDNPDSVIHLVQINKSIINRN